MIDHTLTIERYDRRGIQLLDGEIFTGPTTYSRFKRWPADAQTGIFGHLATSIPSVGEVATAVLARSNPSRADISVPNFLYELKDLPGMLKEIGALKLLGKRRRKLPELSSLLPNGLEAPYL